jgi:hypothetical protein
MTMVELLPETESWPLAARLAGMLGTWIVVVPEDHSETAVLELSASLGSLLHTPVHRLRVGKADELLEAIAALPPEDALIVLGLESFDADAWRQLDANRSRLERSGHSLAVVSEPSVGLMAEQAPNLWSWIGASAWRLKSASVLSDEATTARLEALRQEYGFDDKELVRRAEAKSLQPDPHLTEWLVLIGRGDLVPRSDTDDGDR